MSLFVPFQKLPKDGQLLTEAEETCNAYEQFCKTPTYVWEDECGPCNGTGLTRAGSMRRKSRSSLGTCIACHGIGYVRLSSAQPDAVPEGHALTLNRPELDGEPDVGGRRGAPGTQQAQQAGGQRGAAPRRPSLGQLKAVAGRRQQQEAAAKAAAAGSSGDGAGQPGASGNGSVGSAAAPNSVAGQGPGAGAGGSNGAAAAGNGAAAGRKSGAAAAAGEREPQGAGRR